MDHTSWSEDKTATVDDTDSSNQKDTQDINMDEAPNEVESAPDEPTSKEGDTRIDE